MLLEWESLSLEGGSRSVASITANPAGPPVTDAGLEYLYEHALHLPPIGKLDLSGTEITDAGLKHLKREDKGLWQRSVCVLNLSCTEVTDAGLEYLKWFSPLRVLDLHETQVTDAGLEHLKGMDIDTVNVTGTRVTDAGIEELRRALPSCKVIH